MIRDEEMTTKEALNIIADMCNALQLHPNSRQGKAMTMAISALKKDKGEWIPVSSGELPKSSMIKTLVSCEDIVGLPISTRVAPYNAFSKNWDCKYKVIAWMPLPEPYKTESEE